MKVTLFFDNDNLEVELDDGEIREARAYMPVFDDFTTCTERVLKSDYWREKITEEYLSYIESYKQNQIELKMEDYWGDHES